MGQFVATNILNQITNATTGSSTQKVDMAMCLSISPMMALSIGKKVLVFPRGEAWSEEKQNIVVGRGLGIDDGFLHVNIDQVTNMDSMFCVSGD